MTTLQIPPQATFRQQWLQAIGHLSKSMRSAIIADVVEYQLTGNIPTKISKMRRALFNSFILEIDPDADVTFDSTLNCTGNAHRKEENTPEKASENETGANKPLNSGSNPRKKPASKRTRPKPAEYIPVEKSPYSEEAAVYGADVPEYFIFPDENMLGRFINDPSGYGCLVDNEVPEFTVPLSEVRSVVAEWIDRRRGFLDYRQFRDRLLRVFHGDRMKKYREEHPVPISVW